MSSVKMTFSLASLILRLGLAFATVPALAVTTDTNIGIGGTIDVSNNRFGTISHAGTHAQVSSIFTPTSYN